MGSDLYMNPSDPPPIWEQVKALQERYSETAQRLRESDARVKELERENAAQERAIARLSVQLNGAPFPGEEEESHSADDFFETIAPDGIKPATRAEEREARRQARIERERKAAEGWCTCGVKTPQREHHKHGCPRAL